MGRIIREIRGTVRFRAQDGFPERFLNLARQAGIHLWDLKRQDDYIEGCVTARNYKKLRKPARRSGVKLRIAGKKGLPFLMHRYRKRSGIAVGLLVFCLLLFATSRFIWKIEVRGNERVPTEGILTVLESLGLHEGIAKGSIDCNYEEQRLLLSLHELSLATIYIEGTTLICEVHERTEPPEMIEDYKPCNIIAAKTGLIERMEVYEGQREVQEGDVVEEGDLIISGIVDDKNGNFLYTRHARAKIMAITQETVEIRIPLQETQRDYTGENLVRRSVSILGGEIPLYLAQRIEGNYERVREEQVVEIFSFALPVKVITDTYLQYEETVHSRTEDEAKMLCSEKLKEMEETQFSDREIRNREIEITFEEGEAVLRAEYTFLEDIAQEKEIEWTMTTP